VGEGGGRQVISDALRCDAGEVLAGSWIEFQGVLVAIQQELLVFRLRKREEDEGTLLRVAI
jgi:hypothetical protein